MERLKPTSTSSNKIKDEMIANRELLVLFSKSDAPNGQGAFGILCNMHQLLIFKKAILFYYFRMNFSEMIQE
jgi:hypothetical protein